MSAKRKASKPLMEKKRRDRINQSLAELKELIDATSTPEKNSRRHRLEKADILELTVQHVHGLHKRAGKGNRSQREFVDGFLECVKQLKNFLRSRDADLKQGDRLLRHLDTCVHQMQVPDQIQPHSVWRPW